MRDYRYCSVKKSFLILLVFGLIFSVFTMTTLRSTAAPKPASTEELLKGAPTRSDYPDSDGVIMLDKGVVTVKKGGDKSLTINKRIKVFNKQGRQKYGEVTIPYIAKSGQPKLNYIRTVTPEGKVVKPDKDDIRNVTPARLQQCPMYSDLKNKVVSMPGLTDGAIIDYSYTVTPKRFFLKDDFSSGWMFRTDTPVEVSHFQVTVPKDMDVKWTDFDGDFPPQVTEHGDQDVYTWRRTDLKKITEEPGMPPISRLSGKVMISSIDSWEYYAQEFWKLTKTQIKPNDEIKAKVKELTKGLTSKEEKLRAIYNYVATKIRYVAIELGRGKIQPHKAKEVFYNKYGDCKDKTTLMISMLKVAGIKAHPVLIKSGLDAKTGFNQPPPGMGMNHAIVAVELKDGLKILDPTCDVCPYEYLPDSDRGKKALVINGKKDKVGQITEMDRFNPKSSQVKVHQTVNLKENSDLNTEIDISYSGFYSYNMKATLERYSNKRQKQIFRGLLSQLESGAVLSSFDHSPLEDIDADFTMNLSYSKVGYANKLGDSLIFQSPADLRLPLNRNYGEMVSLPAGEREHPVLTPPVKLVNEIVIDYSREQNVVTPEEVSMNNEWSSYSSSYETSSGKLTITRTFTLKKPLVPVEGYQKFQEAVNAMRKDQRANLQLKDS